ncbi:histone deacetylase family protein [Rhodobacteraceae bacterium N5(2021)]|uniref:Histone deacetylase family protein n=1 Tax=Gymnodinialimonas phycosphaerae TaxID=2841589 RepID=A0A975YF03_9RHOB|nr:histone deacetylase family protein [Gymnodinialimonas phycosphaerae]MBY4894175.1 histone deacetylase family protein [Gymnodinialimonas phycosphaerae]
MLIINNPSGLRHEMPEGHPERIARLETVFAVLADVDAERTEAPLATEADVALCHPQGYIDAMRAAQPTEGLVQIDADTSASPGTWEAAMRGVGGCLLGVDRVLSGAHKRAFVATRPPGHHAEKTRAMGFCLFGSIAIAARHALERHGLSRVAVVDFDVHHGNGTQDLLWDEPRALFVSSHQMPLYPGSGAVHERGGSDNVLNLPLPPGSDGQAMRSRYTSHVFPRLRDWKPDLILISAGFDAHTRDPLANLLWEAEDFAWVTRGLVAVAEEVCEGRIVSTLEGGYDLQGLGDGVLAHVTELEDRDA